MAKTPKLLIKILMPVMSKMTPTCEVVSLKISESLDHKISYSDRIRVRLHLMGCELCARYEKQIHTIHQMMENSINKINEDVAGARLSPESRRKMKQKLNQS